MTIDEALQHAAKELPDGWAIHVEIVRGDLWIGLSDGQEMLSPDLWGRDYSDPLAENILRAVAWAKEQVK